MPRPAVHLTALATASPHHLLRQEDVIAFARDLFGTDREVERLIPAFSNAGIDSRRSCVPLAWYAERHGWKDKNGLYVENAVALATEAAKACLARAELPLDQVDAIVAVSSSGIATPSLDSLVLEKLGLRRDVERLPIFGLGCAGGVLGLARAAAIARSAPEINVLVVFVELCGLTFRQADRTKSNIIATALFGDGAAAALLSCRREGPVLAHWGEHMWPDSHDVMGWHIEDDGFGVLFSRDIPNLVRRDMRPATKRFLARIGLTLDDLDGIIAHPGGAKVLEALQDAFELPPSALGDAREVLRTNGNMSAVTVLFVLDRVLARGLKGRHLMTALGPGFTAAFLLVEGM
jgi:alkylresorcinol/alkylpyrone synthase